MPTSRQEQNVNGREPAKRRGPILILPSAVYLLLDAGAELGLPRSCLPREARLGRLRVSRRGGRNWTTGAWLLQWLEAGEVRRAKKSADVAAKARASETAA